MLFNINTDILLILLLLFFLSSLIFFIIIIIIYRLRRCVQLSNTFVFPTLVGAVGIDKEFCSTLTVSPRPVNCSSNLSPETRIATFMRNGTFHQNLSVFFPISN